MIIVQLAGGLGNQLQQYALYRKLVRMGKEVRLDLSWFKEQDIKNKNFTPRELELERFDRLIYEVCTPEEKTELIGSAGLSGSLRRKFFPKSVKWFRECKMYHPEIFGFENMYVSGYFACEKYYRDILYDLQEKIQFPKSKNPLNWEMEKEMRTCHSVSVHIRRGDYLDEVNKTMFGGICTEEYYQSAVRYILEKFPDAHFYVFSDDAKYVKENYKGEIYTIIDWNRGEDSFYDMQLMSCCKDNICANSTFSFWGARLNANNNKIIIRPTVHKNTQIFEEEIMYDLWQGWTFIDNRGVVFAKEEKV
ncbi:O-antigen biosynthesis glycosyltransferase WbnK [Lachnospiraceae bacterium]|nr:O-antigen biosynthesis glycosyltransferase WbnK [Lachnospiraceae bacterium]